MVLDESGEQSLFPAAGEVLAAAPFAAVALHDAWRRAMQNDFTPRKDGQ
ncbi:MAG: hypothetical protein QM607_00325 [Microbacterium sp.]